MDENIFNPGLYNYLQHLAFAKHRQLKLHVRHTFTMRYPKKAQENKISGTVIVEFDRDSTCVFSNPKVLKGLGYGCDKEAMRAATQIINSTKRCALKCPGQKCSNDKIKQPFIFKYTDEK